MKWKRGQNSHIYSIVYFIYVVCVCVCVVAIYPFRCTIFLHISISHFLCLFLNNIFHIYLRLIFFPSSTVSFYCLLELYVIIPMCNLFSNANNFPVRFVVFSPLMMESSGTLILLILDIYTITLFLCSFLSLVVCLRSIARDTLNLNYILFARWKWTDEARKRNKM